MRSGAMKRALGLLAVGVLGTWAGTARAVTFPLDPAWTRQQLRLVVFLQDARSLAVAGVAVVQLP